jgi:type I restriction enzyme, S subunit
MKTAWPKVKLAEVLRYRKEFITIDDLSTYKRPRVQLHAKGIILRDEIVGALIKTKQQQVCRAGDFLVAEIDAKVGGFGIVPDSLDGAIVSSHYFLFAIDELKIDISFLDYFTNTPGFREQIEAQGSTNYASIRPADVLGYEIPLPLLAEQKTIVTQINELKAKIISGLKIIKEIDELMRQTLLSAFRIVTKNVKFLPMGMIAPLTRRPVKVNIASEYLELGVRSFGKGTFHKPSLSGAAVGSKKLYQIFTGDLVFNNVFAWEGAVAVAKEEDIGRVGSHRFITCIPQDGVVTSEFLRFYFLTDEGLEKLGGASPGGAGRNRTLGLEALGKIKVPIPSIEKQLWFDALQSKIATLKQIKSQTTIEMDALLPSILDKAFRGEL